MGTSNLPWIRRIAALASLGDVNRRKLYEYVLGAGDAVGRDEAATAMNLPRSTVSFHLDRLVREGLLGIEFRKAPDKAGPGSGRPAKLYRPAMAEVSASVPERNYDLAGDLLASGISHSLAEGIPVGEALLEVAGVRGRSVGRPGDFLGTLTDLGYRPSPDASGGYRLLNCPFHRLSQEHRELVCAMNGAFLEGAAEASGLTPGAVNNDAGPGHCCVRITTMEGQEPG